MNSIAWNGNSVIFTVGQSDFTDFTGSGFHVFGDDSGCWGAGRAGWSGGGRTVNADLSHSAIRPHVRNVPLNNHYSMLAATIQAG